MPKVTILYEDSRRQLSREYGPHELVKSYLADVLAIDRYDRRLKDDLVPIPCKGDSNLLKQIQRNGERLIRNGGWVIAVFDADKLHRLVDLDAAACKKALTGAVDERGPSIERLSVVLLEDNLETLFERLKELAEHELRCDWQAVIERKRHAERDRILTSLARDPQRDGLRRQLVQQMPSLAYLMCKVWRAWHATHP